jgi:hypothetical protein
LSNANHASSTVSIPPRLATIDHQLSGEMADYAAIAQEDAANAAAQSSYLFAATATIFTIFAVPATIGFTGAEILGWLGVVGPRCSWNYRRWIVATCRSPLEEASPLT